MLTGDLGEETDVPGVLDHRRHTQLEHVRRFGSIVNLVAAVFQVRVAYIALIDQNRQWFKAKCGLAVDETGRDVYICGHTILQVEPLVVPDTTLDSRFQDNPLVVGEPYVRFYAGCPLAGPGGRKVGTLFIADLVARTFDGDGPS